PPARGAERDRSGGHEAADPPQSVAVRPLEDELRSPPGRDQAGGRGARHQPARGSELHDEAHRGGRREAPSRDARHHRHRAAAYGDDPRVPGTAERAVRYCRWLKVLRLVSDAREFRIASATASLGFVPTMGALHEGHASLIERAVRDHDLAVVSIFVNPTQFGPHEDFAAYPRDESADIAACERLGAAMVFAPAALEMYPPGDATRVQPGAIAERLEGAARPGHFTGVATILTKLFSIVRPDAAYFGQKDFQQLRVVQTMSRDLRFGVAVAGCPIVREPDGLAMSSRNRYLSTDDRQAALAPSTEPAVEELSLKERRGQVLLGTVTAAHFSHHVANSLLNPLLPLIRDAFALSYAESGFAVSAFSIAAGLANAPWGVLADRVGSR